MANRNKVGMRIQSTNEGDFWTKSAEHRNENDKKEHKGLPSVLSRVNNGINRVNNGYPTKIMKNRLINSNAPDAHSRSLEITFLKIFN